MRPGDLIRLRVGRLLSRSLTLWKTSIRDRSDASVAGHIEEGDVALIVFVKRPVGLIEGLGEALILTRGALGFVILEEVGNEPRFETC